MHLGIPVNVSSLQHCKVSTNSAPQVLGNLNVGMRKLLQRCGEPVFHMSDDLLKLAEMAEASAKPGVEQLSDVSLREKREVLRYMQIIPTSIAAAYLGISETALNEWKGYYEAFGARYAGGHCYSLEELKLIANNRWWFYTCVVAHEIRVTDEGDEKTLDQVVMVDEKLAIALTDMARSELIEIMPRNPLLLRQYRLSDLEKFRIAKLNATI